MNEQKYRVEIPDANHLIVLRHRQVRTPVKFYNVNEVELKLLESQAKRYDIKCYVRNEEDTVEDTISIIDDEEEVIIEDLRTDIDDESKISILNQLLES